MDMEASGEVHFPMKTLAFLVLVFSTSTFLRQALESVIKNIEPPNQVIVVEDQSEHGSNQKMKLILEATGFKHSVTRNPYTNLYQYAIHTTCNHCPPRKELEEIQLNLLPTPDVQYPNTINPLNKASTRVFGWKDLNHTRMLRHHLVE